MTVLRNKKLSDVNYQLKAFLVKNGISYGDLAKKTGISPRTVARRFAIEFSPEEEAEIKELANEIVNERG